MEGIKVRRVLLSDIEALQQVGRQTFSETFSGNNSEENMIKYLEEGFAFGKLEDEIGKAGSQFYFAVLKDEVIGYLKLNTGNSQTELREDKSLEIERIYVLQAHQGKKVGQLLYDQAIAVAREINAEYMWLGVWEQNPKAIGFYKKNGFVEFDKHIFMLGDDEQTDIMMKKNMAIG